MRITAVSALALAANLGLGKCLRYLAARRAGRGDRANHCPLGYTFDSCSLDGSGKVVQSLAGLLGLVGPTIAIQWIDRIDDSMAALNKGRPLARRQYYFPAKSSITCKCNYSIQKFRRLLVACLSHFDLIFRDPD